MILGVIYKLVTKGRFMMHAIDMQFENIVMIFIFFLPLILYFCHLLSRVTDCLSKSKATVGDGVCLCETVDIKVVKRHGIFFTKYALKCKVIEDDY